MELTLKVPTALKVQQLPPDETPKSPAQRQADADAEHAAEVLATNKELMGRLDGAAATLVTATAVLIALLAALGLTGDRLTVILNSSPSKAFVIGSVVCAVGAVVCGTLAVALPVTRLTLEMLIIVLGTVFFAGSLGLAVAAASTAFTEAGRPAITEVSVADAAGTGATLSFTVTSDGVAQNAGLRVVAIWVRNSEGPQQLPFYSTALRPNALGIIQQTATIYLSRPDVDTYVRIQVIRMSDAAEAAKLEAKLEAPPKGTLCADQTDQKTASACAEVLVPAAGPPAGKP
jgi:preprotein translocase subunit SecG